MVKISNVLTRSVHNLLGIIIAYRNNNLLAERTLEGSLVVMLILGLDIPELLKIDLLSSSIFLFKSSRKFSLILRILLICFEEICM